MNWIEELDDILAIVEDTVKGSEGDMITKARGIIQDQRSQNFSDKPIEEKADEFTGSLNLDDTRWYGDIHSAYTYGYLQCKSDCLITLSKTKREEKE